MEDFAHDVFFHTPVQICPDHFIEMNRQAVAQNADHDNRGQDKTAADHPFYVAAGSTVDDFLNGNGKYSSQISTQNIGTDQKGQGGQLAAELRAEPAETTVI